MDDESIKISPMSEETCEVSLKSEEKKNIRPKFHDKIKAGPKADSLKVAPEETISELPQPDSDKKVKKGPVDFFTHATTGFPGAWTEEEYSELISAWEEAVDILRASEKAFNIHEKIHEILKRNGFRDVKKDDVVKQIGRLRREYKNYREHQKSPVETEKHSCVPQIVRILRKLKNKPRKTSTASNQADGVSEEDQNVMNNIKQNPPRNKRASYQRKNLQMSIRTMIGQQKTILEYLETVLKTIDESNNKIVLLLEQLVTLQRLN